MAFDVTKPADTQKIRLGPADIRANFAAIQTGDSTFLPDWFNLAVQGGDPGALASAGRIYTKVGTGPDPDLYYQDASGNVIAITQNGSLGGASVDLTTNSITIGPNSTLIEENQFIVAWGKFNSSGTFVNGVNMATTGGTANPSTGVYNVDVNADKLFTADYSVYGSCIDTSASSSTSYRGVVPNLIPAPVPATPTTIQIHIRSGNGLTGNIDFFFVYVVGGQ